MTTGYSLKPKDLDELMDLARDLGATDARIISTADISVEEALAALCKEPRCANYGLSASCPPHVGGPEEFRGLVKQISKALFFKIDLPAENLLSSDRLEIGAYLNEIAVNVEQTAKMKGALDSRAFSGGSCKKLYCREYAECNLVSGRGLCRNPDLARESLSGFGINVNKLMQVVGWKMWHNGGDPHASDRAFGVLCGLVLLE